MKILDCIPAMTKTFLVRIVESFLKDEFVKKGMIHCPDQAASCRPVAGSSILPPKAPTSLLVMSG